MVIIVGECVGLMLRGLLGGVLGMFMLEDYRDDSIGQRRGNDAAETLVTPECGCRSLGVAKHDLKPLIEAVSKKGDLSASST